MTPDTIARKLCNLLVPDAQANLASYMPALGTIGAMIVETPTKQAIESFREHFGGLWVGGAVTLSRTHLAFEPNGMNRALHHGDSSLRVPLSEVRDVTREWGFISGIISIRTTRGTFKLRCWRARALADVIRQALRGELPERAAS